YVAAETYPDLMPSLGVMAKCGCRYMGPAAEGGVVRCGISRDEYVAMSASADQSCYPTVQAAPAHPTLGQIAITVSDVPKATAFYRDVIGLEFLCSPQPSLSFLRSGDVRIMLSVPEGGWAIGANSVLYFKV